ncbi:MAG: LLM class flavin-dependent oxidoreductase [Pseudomonadota bacterium]
MMWSDCYATMALAATNTSKIQIGTGISVPGCRIAPTTAHSIASVNVLAPGRVFLGLGTGHTAMRVMGQDPMRLKDFAEYIRVVRAMLDGEEVDFTFNGKTTSLKWQDHADGFRNIEDRIPIYVAANGPKTLKIAGALGDGLVAAMGEQPDMLDFHHAQVQAGASEAGRDLPDDYYMTAVSHALVLRPGEKLTDDRVIDVAAPWVATMIHFIYEIWRYTRNDDMVPPYMTNIWEEYCDHVDQMDIPEEKVHQVLHAGHCSWCPPAERRFVTPEMILGTGMVGEPEEIAATIRTAGDKGLHELSLLPGLEYARDVAKDFAERVVPIL